MPCGWPDRAYGAIGRSRDEFGKLRAALRAVTPTMEGTALSAPSFFKEASRLTIRLRWPSASSRRTRAMTPAAVRAPCRSTRAI